MRTLLERRPIATSVIYTVIGALPLYLASAHVVQLQRDLGFGTSEFGFIVSAFFAVSTIASKRIGPRIDREGPTRGLRLSALLSCGACVLIGVGVYRWEVLAALLGVVGLANSYGQIASNRAIATVVRSGRQGMAFSAKQAAIPLSALLSGTVVSWAGDAVSWRWSYAAVAALALVLAIFAPRFAQQPTAHELPARRMTPALIVYMVAFGIAGGIGNSIATFATAAAVAAGFVPSVAAFLLTMGSVVAIASRIGAGLSADRRGKTAFLEVVALLVAGAAGLTILGQWGSARPAFVVGLLLSFIGVWGWPGVVSLLVIRTIPLPAATSTGAVSSAAYFGTVVIPPAVGIVAERFSYPAVFTSQSIVIVLATLAVFAGRVLASRSSAAVGAD